MNSENNKPVLIIIRGLPGSGKSVIANELSKKDLYEPIVILDPDSINFDSKEYIKFTEKLTENGVDPLLHPYRYLRNLAYETILEKGTIIWTQAFTNQDLLDRTIKNLKNYSEEKSLELSVLIVEVEIDVSIAKERTKQREEKGFHGVSEENFIRFINDYKTFEEYGYKLIKVNGSDNVEKSVASILDKLRNT